MLMRFLLFLITLLSFLTCYGQVNPNYHKVQGYYRKDGTYVKPHYRTNRNNTNRDNYTTKPNTNPWTGKRGYINPDNNENYYSSSKNQSTSNSQGTDYKKSSTKKTTLNDYISLGNSKTIMVSKLRNKPYVYGDVLVQIPKGAKIYILKKENNYCMVQYGNLTGYLNEMCITTDITQNKTYKTKNYKSEKTTSNDHISLGNSKTIMVSKLRNKPYVYGDVLVQIPKGAKIYIIKKENDYWLVQYGNLIGYLNEMYLQSYSTQNINYKIKNDRYEKPISDYYSSLDNSKTIMVAKLRNKPYVYGEIVARIPKGAKIFLIKKDGNYWKVKYKNLVGYLNKMYIEGI